MLSCRAVRNELSNRFGEGSHQKDGENNNRGLIEVLSSQRTKAHPIIAVVVAGKESELDRADGGHGACK